MKKIALVVLLLALLPTAQPVLAQDPLCAGYGDGGGLHHTPAPWLEEALRSGGFQAYRFGTSLIIAFQVAACGGKWMFARFNAGAFTTNFIPSRGWGYILDQVRRARATPVKGSIVAIALKALAAGMAAETAVMILILPRTSDICRYLPTVAAQMPECNRA